MTDRQPLGHVGHVCKCMAISKLVDAAKGSSILRDRPHRLDVWGSLLHEANEQESCPAGE